MKALRVAMSPFSATLECLKERVKGNIREVKIYSIYDNGRYKMDKALKKCFRSKTIMLSP